MIGFGIIRHAFGIVTLLTTHHEVLLPSNDATQELEGGFILRNSTTQSELIAHSLRPVWCIGSKQALA